jgi:glycosyltransferase involved in cell wall biosynthesis
MAQFSICLLAHNSARFIGTAVQSVLAQHFQDWEMLISDDASTDDTADVVRPFLGDRRIRYVHHDRNLKQAPNWSFAIANTSAPYVATLHADDAWEPHALDTMAAEFAAKSNLDLVWANWDFYDADLQVRERSAGVAERLEMSGHEAAAWLAEHNPTLPSAAAFSRRVVVKAGYPDHRYGMMCDRDYFLRLATHAQVCRAVPVVVTRYRRHTGSVTHDFSTSGKLREEMVSFARHAGEVLHGHPEASKLAANIRSEMGRELVRDGLVALARGHFRKSWTWLCEGVGIGGMRTLQPSVARKVCRDLWYRTVKRPA